MKSAAVQQLSRNLQRECRCVDAADAHGKSPRRTPQADSRNAEPSTDHRVSTAILSRRRIDWRSDTGSGGMSLMMLVCAVALLMILGLVVDGGAKARALDHAGAIASEAARAAAATYRPGDVAIDPAAADQAAQDYLTAAGATGSVTVTGLDVSATATLKQATVFLPLVGIDAFTVTGAGQAQVVYQQGGTP
jgi:hypothetical protein